MDQLENQVSDLRSFLEPAQPIRLPSVGGHDTCLGYSPPAGGPGPQMLISHNLLHSAPGDNSALMSASQPREVQAIGGKRKSVDEDERTLSKQSRSKRNRYISIACNECKRRKIKCNGQTPCQRCGNLNLQCLYAPNCCPNSIKDADEFKEMVQEVHHLQQQVESLFSSVSALRQENFSVAPIQDRMLPSPLAQSSISPTPVSTVPSIGRSSAYTCVASSFSGPTINASTVDVAKNTLHDIGYLGLDGHEDSNASIVGSAVLSTTRGKASRAHLDPLWEFDKDEMVRLCRQYDEEVGIMYPVVKIDSVIQSAKDLARWMASRSESGLSMPEGEYALLTDLSTLEIKIIMCCGLVVEGHGKSDKANRLYDSIQPIVDRKLMTEPASISTLPFLALVGGYRFLSGDEVLAWRVMGQVARLCQELGLNRRDVMAKISHTTEGRTAINTFWTAYVLDRRWAFGTGLPYVCQDDKIDPKLPYPENHPYLVAMITYSKLSTKVWKMVDFFEPAMIRELRGADLEALDREVLEWYESVPDEIRVSSLDMNMIPSSAGPAYDLQRLQIWTRLRLNQIRIWLHTPVLHSAISTAENLPLAQKAVDLAKETIQYLTQLNNTTNLYRRTQVFYQQFLTSAIAVLFLASTHASLHFSSNCRTEFYHALELVKDMSPRSWISQRLWRAVRTLKAYALRPALEEEEDPHADAALAMAGMATGGMAMPSPTNGQSSGLIVKSDRQSSSSGPVELPSVGTQVGAQVQQGHQEQQQQAPPSMQLATDETENWLRLHFEMTRIFEGYTMSAMPSVQSSRMHSPDAPAKSGNETSECGGTEENMYQELLRELF